jgi:ABC-type amino acid transport system permease subunit
MRLAAEAARDGTTLVGRANALLPGLYAWVTTVALPASAARAPLSARIAAGAALIALLVGSWLGPSNARWSRRVGLFAFVPLAAITWLLLGDLLASNRLEPIRASLGGVAWALFAVGWGAPRRPGAVPEDDPRALVDDVLEPRRRLPRGANTIITVALLLAVVPVFLAWRIPRAEHALLGHAVALGAAVAMVTVGAIVAVERGNWRAATIPRRRLARAAGPLGAVLVLLVVGILYGTIG